MVVGARQSFQTKKTGFLEIIGLNWVLHNLYQIIKKLVRENQFQINYASHFKKLYFLRN